MPGSIIVQLGTCVGQVKYVVVAAALFLRIAMQLTGTFIHTWAFVECVSIACSQNCTTRHAENIQYPQMNRSEAWISDSPHKSFVTCTSLRKLHTKPFCHLSAPTKSPSQATSNRPIAACIGNAGERVSKGRECVLVAIWATGVSYSSTDVAPQEEGPTKTQKDFATRRKNSNSNRLLGP